MAYSCELSIQEAEAGGSGFRGHLVSLPLKTHRNPKQKQQHVTLLLWPLSSLVICDGVLFFHGLLVVVVVVSTHAHAFCFIFWPWVLGFVEQVWKSDLGFCPMHSSWSCQTVMECLKTYNRGDGLPYGTQSDSLRHWHVMRQGISSLGCGDVCQASPLWSYCLTPLVF